MWNGIGDADTMRRKNDIIDQWCAEVGRDPAEIERTALVAADVDPEPYLAAGITHLIVSSAHPFDLAPIQRLLDVASS
jgi:hypothetical protein